MAIVGFCVFFICVLARRWITAHADRQLNPAEETRLRQAMEQLGGWHFLIPIALLVAFFALLQRVGMYRPHLQVGFFCLSLVYYLALQGVQAKKHLECELPRSYRQLFWLAQLIAVVGFIGIFMALFYS